MEPTRADPGRATTPPGGSRAECMRATVFGLDIRSETPLSFLEGSSAGPTGRALGISREIGDAAMLDWPDSVELICDQRDRDGSLVFGIEAHPEAGYLIRAPEHGAYLLSADGRRLRCASDGCAEDVWERLLIAQALPFAALLHGLEVFHASAVARRGEAVAILGPSGAGKTSVALELCRLGADFLADDVLALEVRDGGLLVHPGTQIAGLDHSEARRLEKAGKPRREKVAAVNERERLLRMRGVGAPTPLAALFFLDRRSDGPPSPRFEPVADAQALLGATFNFVLTTPERLRGLLEVCALAAQLRVERVLAGPDVDATVLAGAVEQRMETSP
jgi:hypothetical protein